MKTIGYSRPLALCSVISVTRPSSSRARVGVGDERDLLQEDVEAVLVGLGGGVELARDLDELLQVLEAALGLDRALGLERVEVARLVQQRLEQVADRDALLGARRAARSSSSMKRSSALTAAAPRPGTAAGSAAASQTLMPIVSAWRDARATATSGRSRAAASWRRA